MKAGAFCVGAKVGNWLITVVTHETSFSWIGVYVFMEWKWPLLKSTSQFDAAVFCLTVLIAWFYFRRRASNRVYGKSHSLLNQPDDTLWQNMGYWEEQSTFREACEKLTRLVAESISLTSNDALLDLGYGCGEEIKYIQNLYSPRLIRGCTSHPRQSQYAKFLCARTRSIYLETDDAISWCQQYPRTMGGRQVELFDAVVLIDCAYHFKTRRKLFESLATHCLHTGSRVGLADIVLSPSFNAVPLWKQRLMMYVLFPLMSVPIENMKVIADYKADLVDAGFTQIKVRTITANVFSPLSGYIRANSKARQDRRWLPFLFFSYILQWWCANDLLEYVIVSAVAS